ncbi:EboA domain-containing protein [Sporocytophaga myxococcoides]|uniref:EboA domain-containing protein n=1 Tax=Sporocytophaga myxococcoides TaxID=153721 RepID=UPI000417085B|nr:EboA domain-containing protein [Sporocytophaga myxococcoides]
MKNTFSIQEVKAARHFIEKKIALVITEDQYRWYIEQIEKVRSGVYRNIYFAFSKVSTVFGKRILDLNEDDLIETVIIRKGWNPSFWTVTEFIRINMLMELTFLSGEEFLNLIKNIFGTADLDERVAILKGLSILPYQNRLTEIASEGVRSNSQLLFEAIALNNPFPCDFFNESQWNQMVLKAAFIDSPISDIFGLERRANAALSDMAIDLVHERKAASREITPEIWRIIAPFLSTNHLKDVKALFEDKNQLSQETAALTCYVSNTEEAVLMLLDHRPDLHGKMIDNELSWQDITNKWNKMKLQEF